jgi:hypothetical protein
VLLIRANHQCTETRHQRHNHQRLFHFDLLSQISRIRRPAGIRKRALTKCALQPIPYFVIPFSPTQYEKSINPMNWSATAILAMLHASLFFPLTRS